MAKSSLVALIVAVLLFIPEFNAAAEATGPSVPARPFDCQQVLVVMILSGHGRPACDLLEELAASEPGWKHSLDRQIRHLLLEYPEPDTLRLLAEVIAEKQDTIPQVLNGSDIGVEVWRPLVERYFRPGDVDRALRIMRCESSGDPLVVNPSSGASGLFQHMPRYWPERSGKAGLEGADVFDPVANVAVAAWLAYHGGGWRHWVCK